MTEVDTGDFSIQETLRILYDRQQIHTSRAQRLLASSGGADSIGKEFFTAASLQEAMGGIMMKVGVVFSTNGNTPLQEVTTVDPKRYKFMDGTIVWEDDPLNAKPKTFAQLLRQRVRTFFSKTEEQVSKEQLLDFILKESRIGRSSMTNAFNVIGIDMKTGISSDKIRVNEAMAVFYYSLTIPTGPKFNPKVEYSRTNLMTGFKTDADFLDQAAGQIGFDWEQTRTINLTEALNIRGLVRIEDIKEQHSYFGR